MSTAGLVPLVKLASGVGLRSLADKFLTVPTGKGANSGLKVSSMVAGADSIDDMAILRHGGMRNVFDSPYAPSTLGSFLRTFTFGHVRQLDAVACRVLAGLSSSASTRTPGTPWAASVAECRTGFGRPEAQQRVPSGRVRRLL